MTILLLLYLCVVKGRHFLSHGSKTIHTKTLLMQTESADDTILSLSGYVMVGDCLALCMVSSFVVQFRWA